MTFDEKRFIDTVIKMEEDGVLDEGDREEAVIDYILQEREIIFEWEEIYYENEDLECEYLTNFIFDEWEIEQQERYIDGLGNKQVYIYPRLKRITWHLQNGE
jgi:hypothetical protein